MKKKIRFAHCGKAPFQIEMGIGYEVVFKFGCKPLFGLS